MLIWIKIGKKVDTMNRKINTICFIFLFFFLICTVSAADNENETFKTISPDLNDNQDIYSVCDEESLQTSTIKNDKVEFKDENTISSNTVSKKKVSILTANVNMYYKDGHKFSVTLKDENKKAVANAKVKITIDGKTYTKITDKQGYASLNLNFKSGKYIVLTSFDSAKNYREQSKKNIVNIKSTISCDDFTKYYTNTEPYSATFCNNNGQLLKYTKIQFNINNKNYYSKTNYKGIVKLPIDLKPGRYNIKLINPKTTEIITKSITIKSLIETKDLVMNQNDGSRFNVKIFNNNGKAASYKNVNFYVDGKIYVKITDKNGKTSIPINLDVGTHSITTEFNGLKCKNKITVNKVIKYSEFTYSIKIPNYVNVTIPQVFQNSQYSLKTGNDGIIKMPKIEYFTLQVGLNSYNFTTSPIDGYDAITIDENYFLIPFDNSELEKNSNINNLKGNGILIYKTGEFTQIDYRDKTNDTIELFGAYADKGKDGFETVKYMKNDEITAILNFKTIEFDEYGLKYSLSKYYGKSISDLNYNDIDKNIVKFSKTNESVQFNESENNIIGTGTFEDIITTFNMNGKEESQRTETISYGFSNKYRKTLGFEVLQTYSIINEKVTQKIVEEWISKNPSYLTRFGVMNVYGMHLASLETTWLADTLADSYSNEYCVSWKRGHTLTILGGINMDDTYINILNADMGMDVTGAKENVILFRLINSMNLPNLEDYSLSEVAKRYWDHTTNSLENIINSIANNQFSISQLGEMIYIFSEDGNNSGIIVNSTSGVVNVIIYNNNNIYKGSSIPTTRDCCGVGIMPKDLIKGIKDVITICSDRLSSLSNALNKTHTMSKLAFKAATYLAGKIATGSTATGVGVLATMVYIQQMGVDYRDEVLDKKDWHSAMDIVTFTRPGYLQSKKIYNIPNKNGGYDYVEAPIKSDFSLDRENTLYISNGNVRKLTKQETYEYYSNDYYTLYNVPPKYWRK